MSLSILNQTITKLDCWQIRLPLMLTHQWYQCKKLVTKGNKVYRYEDGTSGKNYIFGQSNGLIFISMYLGYDFLYQVQLTYYEFKKVYTHFIAYNNTVGT
jgi:hypothetical protein